MIIEVTDEQVKDALQRIARTPDGEVLYRFLQKELMGVLSSGASEGAFREHNGRRSFASTLMGLMADGIETSGRNANVIFRRSGSVSNASGEQRPVYRPAPGGRRIDARTFVPGFDGIPDDSSEGGAPGVAS